MSRKKKRPKKIEVSVSSGTTVKEALPLPIVYYPKHYGTFFAFSDKNRDNPKLCACSRSAVENYFALTEFLKAKKGNDEFKKDQLDKSHFPIIICDLLKDKRTPFTIKYEKKLCHRCNQSAPSLGYCNEMYGTKFIQRYGWYVKVQYLKLGILPSWLIYLEELCPTEYIDELVNIQNERDMLGNKRKAISLICNEQDTSSLNKLQKSVYQQEADHSRLVSEFNKKIENITRSELGFKKAGEGWVSETLLYNIVTNLFPDEDIIRHQRPEWLQRLELDIYLPNLKLGIEYQGQQHFHPIQAWGGKKALFHVQRRDELKKEICKEHKVILVTIDYTDPLTQSFVNEVIQKMTLM